MTGLLSRMISDSNAHPKLGSSSVARSDGYLPLEDYAALREGRSVALSGKDGSIDTPPETRFENFVRGVSNGPA